MSSERSYLSRLLPRPWWLLALALGLALPASAQAPGTWAPMADLNRPRAEHTATLLANGTVLIAGGRDAADQPLALAEIYDPATGGYRLLASPLPAPVWGHTATRLNDGTVLIAGGQRGARYRRAAQLFDPASDTFAALTPMSTPRGRHTATLLRDGRVVVIGGTDGVASLASLEIYDPTTRTFSLAPSALAVPRQDHTATLLPDGRVLVAGGSNASGALDSAELYDPTAGTVSPGGPLNIPRTLASAALLMDGTVLVAGGQTTTGEDLDSAEVYDAAANAFAWLSAPMGTARSGHLGVQLLHNGKVLISGGTSGGQLVANAEVYDPVMGAFQPVDSPGTARRLFGANFFEVPYAGILLATGGLDGSDQPLASSEAFYYPTLRTDKPDYEPGETVTLMGAGWRPNERVTINLHESSGDPDTNLTATADASGAFTNSEFQINPDSSDVGVRFLATATGQASGWTAQARFTDAPPPKITAKQHEGQLKPSGAYSSGNITQYKEGESINFRFTLEANAATSGQLEVRFTSNDGNCLFFDGNGSFTLGTHDSSAPPIQPISGATPTVTTAGPPVDTDSGTSNGEWVQTLNISFSGEGEAVVNYFLILSDQAGDCSGSSQHSRLNPAGGDVKQTGEQNVPVPAKDIIELAKPTLTTIATPGIVNAPISDTAILSGGSTSSPLGGTVIFTAYGPNDLSCSNAPAFTSSEIGVTPTGPGSGTAMASFSPSAAGTYLWIASYTGDGNNAATATACGDLGETSVVDGNHEEPPPQDPTVTTVSCNPPTVQVDQATTCTTTVGSFVVGAPITTPTGAASFFADASTTAFASCTLRATPTTGVASCSVAYRTATVGVHTITAGYRGDSTHEGSTIETAFPVTVVPAVPGLGL